MPPILFASNFLAGSLLTILLPLGLLIVLSVWSVRIVRRVPENAPTSSATLPHPDVVAAAGDSVDDVTPAGPPPGEIV
jgi:hypothetical protein